MDLKRGDLIEGEIVDFTHEGKGVIKLDDFVLFVEGGVIGDYVEAQVRDLKKRFGNGRVTKIIKESEDRLDLDINESLGGIPLVNYNYDKQLEWKEHKVIYDLERIGKIEEPKVLDIIGMDNPFNYRNHVQIPVHNRNGKNLLGFYEINSNKIVDMDETILLPEVGNIVFKEIKSWMEDCEIDGYNSKDKTGVVKHIGIRVNDNDEIMVIIVTGSEKLPRKDKLIDRLKDKNVISIYHNIHRSKSSRVYGRKFIKIYGEDELMDSIGGYDFYVSPNSFFQINRVQAKVLYETAMEMLEPGKEDTVYDLYSGIGTISLYIADKTEKVYGIEVVEGAIDDADKNSDLNKIDNVEFIHGKAEELFPKLLEEGVMANKLVMDPPRTGCEPEVLEAIVKLNPERIVYVSCNPSTMSRDIKHLVEHGYELVKVQPVDMFPHTAHVEAVSLLIKK